MTHIGFIAARNVAVSLIAGTLLGTICAPASAAPEGTAPVATVKYEDLNLATRQGAETLYRRLTAAAYTVCWPQDHGDLTGSVALRKCIHQAMGKAVAEVNNPVVTALYEHGQLPATLATAPTKRE